MIRSALAAAVLAALALLSGCGAPPPPDHTDADVSFAQMMIPHHQQAVAMSALAPTRASSPRVRDLAARISSAQAPEIDRMTGMLRSWGAAPGGGMGGGMPGMMSDADMGRLASMSGPAFDRDFLQMMISHHRGAVDMARTELARGRDPQARDLAGSIVGAQETEIAEMQGLLARV